LSSALSREVRSTVTNTNQPASLPVLRLQHHDCDDLQDQSAWSLTHSDHNWSAGKRATLPARLQPSYDVQQMTDVCTERPTCGDSMGSSSSVDTDATTDCDVTADGHDVDTDSCDEVSVDSFTFSRSTSQPHDLNASSATLLGQAVATGSDARSKDDCVDDSNSVASTSPCDAELHSTKAPANVALTSRTVTSGPLIRTNMVVTNMGSGGTRKTHHENAQLHEIEDISPSTTRSRLSSGQLCNGGHKTVDASQMVLMSSKDTSIENTKSTSQLEVPRTEDGPCDSPRYRTSISLSVSAPSVSAATSKSFHQSTRPQQRGQSSVEQSDCEEYCDVPPPPPLPVSAQPDVAPSNSDDEESDHVNGELTSVDSGTSGDVKARDNRGSDDPEKIATNSAVMKTESARINIGRLTPVTTATGRDTRTDVVIIGRPFVKRFALCYRSVLCLPVCNVGELWPDDWMGEDETWPHCQMGTQLPSPKGAQPPNFRPISVVAKWLDGSRCHLVGR